MASGYSGTPLARKLGFKPGMRLWLDAVPASIRAEIDDQCPGLVAVGHPADGFEGAHLFTTSRSMLADQLPVLMAAMDRSGFIWISWPKKAAKMDTDMTEDVIRDEALPLGLVDVKVCAVDAIWSGLKLVIRKELR